MKKVICKILLIVIIMNFAILGNVKTVKAESFWDGIISSGENFLETGRIEAATNTDAASDEETSKFISILYNTLLTLGVIITIAVGGVMGIKFMMASAEDKAKIKESMVPYVVGSILIFGAFGIWKMFITIFSQI